MITKFRQIIDDNAKIHAAIERLTNKHIVSVNEEANKYCYKCFTGEIGVVDKSFIKDRILAKLF